MFLPCAVPAVTPPQVLPCLHTCLTDYSTDNRGDVGSWVREAGMEALVSVVKLLADHGLLDVQLQGGHGVGNVTFTALAVLLCSSFAVRGNVTVWLCWQSWLCGLHCGQHCI